jgi:uncharacterized cupin superfamily protein
MNETYLLSGDEIAVMDALDKIHFLNPDARRLNKSLGDAAGLTGFGFHLVEVRPGDQTTEHHFHHNEDECVFVLSGTATAFIGDEDHQIGPGDFIGYRKGGLPHSIKNTGSETFRYIMVGERLSHDVCDYTRLGKRMYRMAGTAKDLVDQQHIVQVAASVGQK